MNEKFWDCGDLPASIVDSLSNFVEENVTTAVGIIFDETTFDISGGAGRELMVVALGPEKPNLNDCFIAKTGLLGLLKQALKEQENLREQFKELAQQILEMIDER